MLHSRITIAGDKQTKDMAISQIEKKSEYVTPDRNYAAIKSRLNASGIIVYVCVWYIL